jgi:hypothetical protein
MIILTAFQAERVRGLTKPGHAIAPVPLADGTFALPEAVKTNPEHAEYAALLDTFPTVLDSSIRTCTSADPTDPNSPIIDSDWEQNHAVRAHYTYSQEWEPGVLVADMNDPPLILF